MRRHALISMATLLLVGLLSGCGAAGRPPVAPPAPEPPAAAPAPVTPAPPPDARPVIACFGDSLTAGLGVSEKDNYPSQLQRRLDAEGYNYHVVNLGISGDTSAGGLARLSEALSLKPRVMILELGPNDGLRGTPVSETEKSLAKIIEQAQAAGVTVVLAGMQMPPNLGPDYTAAFAQVFPDLATRYKLPLIPFFLEGVGGVRELNAADGSGHPNAAGYTIVTTNVWKVLRPLLQK